MRLTDEVWPSDNTDPFDRLSIQDGFTYAYAPGVMMAWVTDSPNWVNQRMLYRLISPRDDSPYSATQSVSSDGRQAVLFAFLHSSTMLNPYPRIHLKGLDPQARYRLRVVAGKPEEGTPVEASGAYWMSEGIELMLKGDFQAAAAVLDRQAATAAH